MNIYFKVVEVQIQALEYIPKLGRDTSHLIYTQIQTTRYPSCSNRYEESLRGHQKAAALLFHERVGYNIHYGNWKASWDDVINAAMQAQIHDIIMNFPDGYDTIVG
jgi:hypothetical protein